MYHVAFCRSPDLQSFPCKATDRAKSPAGSAIKEMPSSQQATLKNCYTTFSTASRINKIVFFKELITYHTELGLSNTLHITHLHGHSQAVQGRFTALNPVPQRQEPHQLARWRAVPRRVRGVQATPQSEGSEGFFSARKSSSPAQAPHSL